MIQTLKNLLKYHELIEVLAWKSILVRYKQAYFGLAWSVLKPLCLLFIFVLVKGFVGIESGPIPYPILTFAALMPWIFFQESASEGVGSVVAHGALIKKIYFPREVFPLTATVTKLIELGINFVLLAGLMIYFRMVPSIHILWVPLIILYTVVVSLAVSFAGAAVYVYYRDVGQALPIFFSLMMYASPVLYPLSLVQQTLLVNQDAGKWSQLIYGLYVSNPLTGIIDAFQKTLLYREAPDLSILWPGMLLTALLLPLSYLIFKKAETFFADVI